MVILNRTPNPFGSFPELLLKRNSHFHYDESRFLALTEFALNTDPSAVEIKKLKHENELQKPCHEKCFNCSITLAPRLMEKYIHRNDSLSSNAGYPQTFVVHLPESSSARTDKPFLRTDHKNKFGLGNLPLLEAKLKLISNSQSFVSQTKVFEDVLMRSRIGRDLSTFDPSLN